MKFKTLYNAHTFPRYDEHSDMASETIPDQAMTIPQLLDRHQRGLLGPDALRTPIYQSDSADMDGELFPRWNSLDITEKEEYLHAARNRVIALRTEMLQEQADIKKSAAKEAAKASKPEPEQPTPEEGEEE